MQNCPQARLADLLHTWYAGRTSYLQNCIFFFGQNICKSVKWGPPGGFLALRKTQKTALYQNNLYFTDMPHTRQ